MRRTKELFFNVGVAAQEQEFLLVGLFYEYEGTETEVSRIVACEDGEWFWLDDVDGIVTILLDIPQDGVEGTMAVTRTGEVTLLVNEDRTDTRIPIDPGHLFGGIAIASSVFVCGSQNQVWRWNGRTWVRAGDGANVNSQIGAKHALYGIHGVAEDDVYAVGTGGTIVRFDGTQWSAVNSPTNVSLHRVLHLGLGELLVVGRAGQVFRGSPGTGWHSLALEGVEANFWGLCRFGDAIYCSTTEAIYRVEGARLEVVNTGRNGPKTIERLFANDRYMWVTTGTDQIFRFDGKKWLQLVCPENE